MNSHSSSLPLCSGRESQIRHVLLQRYKPCSVENSFSKSTIISPAWDNNRNDTAKNNNDVAPTTRCKRRRVENEHMSNGSIDNVWKHAAEAKQEINFQDSLDHPVASCLQNHTTIAQTVHSIHYDDHPQNATISKSHTFQQHSMIMMPTHSLCRPGGNQQHPIPSQHCPHSTTLIHQPGIMGNHQAYPSPHSSIIPWQPNLHTQHLYSISHQKLNRTGATRNHPYSTSAQHQLPSCNPSCGQHPVTNFGPNQPRVGYFHPINSVVFPPKSMDPHVHVAQSDEQGHVDNLSAAYCTVNLNPAPIPLNPLDDDDDDDNVNARERSARLEKECAWLVEETSFLLPFLPNEAKTTTTNSAITTATHMTNTITDEDHNSSILFDLAWFFGSLELRTIIFHANTTLVSKSSYDPEMTVEGLCKRYCRLNNYDPDNSSRSKNDDTILMDVHPFLPSPLDEHVLRRFHRCREEARKGLRLGYRRSESIGQILDIVRRFRLRQALEERGEAVDDRLFDSLAVKKNRRRRKRKDNFVAGGDISELTSKEMEGIALQKPVELTDLEEETAWLCEESLLLPPKISDALKRANGRHEIQVSAGLLTQVPDVDWNYVVENASPDLKVKLQKARGQLGHRTLQRIVRHSNVHVRMAFFKRRENIAYLLVVGGYRRAPTKEVLPSSEELIQSGVLDILKIKLMRRMRKRPKTVDLASTRQLKRVCNRRLSDKSSAPCKPRKKKRAGRPLSIDTNTSIHRDKDKRMIGPLSSVDCVKNARLSEREQDSSNTKNQRTSILNTYEEEIAWLREEFEVETGGLKGFDWAYIENYSTSRLRQEMLRRGVLFSVFPTICGVSKLKAMVRMDDPKVYNEFHRKRRDVRCAIKNGFRRDLRKEILPDIPPAPERIVGTHVMNLELAVENDQAERTGSGDVPVQAQRWAGRCLMHYWCQR